MIRTAGPEDYPFMQELDQIPEIKKQQLPVSKKDYERIQEELDRQGKDLTCHYVIMRDKRKIGLVYRCKYPKKGKDITGQAYTAYQLGFNLHPEYWGRGIMAESISEVFRLTFTSSEPTYIIADCFPRNTRCKNLLSKLGFLQGSMFAHQRVKCWMAYRRIFRFERYFFNHEMWRESEEHKG